MFLGGDGIAASYCLQSLLGMLVRSRRVLVRMLAMLVSRIGVLLGLLVLAQIVMVGGLMMVMGGGVVMSGGLMMMLTGRMLWGLCHGVIPPNRSENGRRLPLTNMGPLLFAATPAGER